MFAIEADLSVGRSVWSAPSFLETLISEEPRQPNSNVLLIRRSWHQSGQMAILLVLIKSGSAADSDQPTTLKNLRRSLFIPTYIRQQVKPGYRKSDSERFSPRWHLCDDHSSTQTLHCRCFGVWKEQLAGIIRWEQNASGHAGCGKGRIR